MIFFIAIFLLYLIFHGDHHFKEKDQSFINNLCDKSDHQTIKSSINDVPLNIHIFLIFNKPKIFQSKICVSFELLADEHSLNH